MNDIVMMPIESVKPPPFPRPLSEALVASIMAAEITLPPILIRASGELVDGAHRLEAWRRMGRKLVIAQIVPDDFIPDHTVGGK